MTTKLSEPMQKELMKLGDGWGWDDFDVHGPLSYAARVRTCKALAKRGLVTYAFGDYDLTEPGETVAKQLNDQAKVPRPAKPSHSPWHQQEHRR
ncbi:hypothetical protein ALP29_200453 [Pseudomonas syringae pv. avii]|uniref:Uncharacterized protein n=1 Tax=Pseudomonas syringae pv. avii TaxID=663959 RepID=A0A3M5VKA4_PSESX|nr:hypothetical protein ALP29_200453 [Pseudomonas syringae pv. avii]